MFILVELIESLRLCNNKFMHSILFYLQAIKLNAQSRYSKSQCAKPLNKEKQVIKWPSERHDMFHVLCIQLGVCYLDFSN